MVLAFCALQQSCCEGGVGYCSLGRLSLVESWFGLCVLSIIHVVQSLIGSPLSGLVSGSSRSYARCINAFSMENHDHILQFV